MALDIKKASDGAKKNIKMLIYGKSGTKKTRFSTGFLEGALVLDFEGGLGSALNPDIDTYRCKEAGDMAEALEFLSTDTKYHTVIVDSWYEYCEKLFLALKELYPNKADGMNLWSHFDLVVRQRHDQLIALDKNIITISLQETIVTDMIAQAHPMMKAKKFKEVIGAKYDLVGHMSYDKSNKRSINFGGTDYATGKNRFEGKVPNIIEEDEELFSASKLFELIQSN